MSAPERTIRLAETIGATERAIATTSSPLPSVNCAVGGVRNGGSVPTTGCARHVRGRVDQAASDPASGGTAVSSGTVRSARRLRAMVAASSSRTDALPASLVAREVAFDAVGIAEQVLVVVQEVGARLQLSRLL